MGHTYLIKGTQIYIQQYMQQYNIHIFKMAATC